MPDATPDTLPLDTNDAPAAEDAQSDGLLSIDVEVPTDDGGTETKTLRFKSITRMPCGLLRRIRHENREEQMWVVFEWALGADDLAILDELPGSEAWETLRKLQRASGIDLGE